MKKRIVCVLLTLIMLMSLVPLTASAAGMTTSESAITVLKQMEGYTTKCNANGYTGYGTLCTEKGTHGSHTINEKLADKALREKLEELDDAVNSFASRKGISLSQNKHDAMVLFSFENGTAWTTGTGDLQAAIASGKTGSEFLNAICWWDNSTGDDYRRMVEANMYLNGVYSSSKPSQFIRVTFNANGGTLTEAQHQYFDVTKAQAIDLVPTRSYYTFMGWYSLSDSGYRLTSVTADHSGATLFAHWQGFADEAADWDNSNYSNVSYSMYAKDLASTTIYALPNGIQTRSIATGYIKINCEFLDDNGNRWGRMVDNATGTKIGWVLLKDVSGVSGSSNSGVYIDVTVTVTNSYVRSRVNADIHSRQNGTYNQGDQLRIINTADADGFLWGQVAKSATDNTPIGWVALMYTNWESVRNDTNENNSVSIATATITFNGYVNVRSDAGTNNKIVGALPTGTTVELYETKYVNGLQWGRCKTGWFCLAYADVQGLDEDANISDVGFTSYAFTGVLVDPTNGMIFEAPSMNAEVVRIKDVLDPNVTITNLTSAEGYTWGKFSKGWVRVTDNATYEPVDVDLHTAKFYVSAESLTVRETPNTSAARIDSLIKGVEFDVNRTKQIVVVGDSVWGYADKVGEDNRSYAGWVNLATKNVTRNGAPTIEGDDKNTGKVGTVINTNNLKVRKTGATYGAQIGTLTMGTTVAIWEENDGWYKVDSNQNGTYDYKEDGWVSGTYLEISDASSSSTSSGTSTNGTGAVQTGMGVVANTYSGVNVRQGAGTAYAAVGKLLPGTAVEILEVKTAGASKWGRTAQGWVCMDYITMVSNYEIAGTTSGTTGSNTTGTVTEAEDAIYTGTTKNAVTVYKETSNKSDAVRTLEAGANITLHEIVTVVEETTTNTADSSTGSTTTTVKTTSYWARINDGYIEAPADNINLDTVDENTYTVTGTDKLNVRNAAGTAGTTVMDKLVKGDQVSITDLQIVNGNVWGKAEYEGEEGQLVTGWVSLKYMGKGAITIVDESQNNTNNNTNTNTGNTTVTNPVVMGNGSSTGGFVTNTSGYRYTGKVIRTNSLNVRSTPSDTASKTTTLTSGQAMVIYETTTVNGMAWGRCDAGWVYLYYVDLMPVTGAVDARVVANENTVIYSDMNCSSVAGTYAKQSVVDIFEIVGKMARTELGWINTDNLL